MALNDCLFPLEIKCKTTLSRHDARKLRACRETYPQEKIAPSLIIHTGQESYPLNCHTTAIP